MHTVPPTRGEANLSGGQQGRATWLHSLCSEPLPVPVQGFQAPDSLPQGRRGCSPTALESCGPLGACVHTHGVGGGQQSLTQTLVTAGWTLLGLALGLRPMVPVMLLIDLVSGRASPGVAAGQRVCRRGWPGHPGRGARVAPVRWPWRAARPLAAGQPPSLRAVVGVPRGRGGEPLLGVDGLVQGLALPLSGRVTLCPFTSEPPSPLGEWSSCDCCQCCARTGHRRWDWSVAAGPPGAWRPSRGVESKPTPTCSGG